MAFIGDILENIKLLTITENLVSGSFQNHLDALFVFTWIKWGSLAMTFAVLSTWFFKGRIVSNIFTILSCTLLVLAIMAYKAQGVYNELLGL